MSTDGPSGRRTIAGVDAELTPEQRRSLRASARSVAARTREFLPDDYVVGAEVSRGADGAQATVAVQPPLGDPVRTGSTKGFEDDPEEVARGLAASAALQVKRAYPHDRADPTAR